MSAWELYQQPLEWLWRYETYDALKAQVKAEAAKAQRRALRMQQLGLK